MEIEVRAALREDLAAIAAIQAVSLVASPWNPEDYMQYDCTVAADGGRVAGFVVVRQLAPGEREVLNFAVHPDYRRRGVGRRLIQAELARGPGARFLEVRASNRVAIEFYTSMGFKQCGRREGYYGNPREDALVLVARSG